MMLDHLELADAANALNGAVTEVLGEKRVRTADLGGSNTTQEVTQAVTEIISRARH